MEEKKPLWYENKIKRNIEYQKNNTKRIVLDLNKNTDNDIIDKLEEVPNKQGYIKQLIREDISKK